MSNFKFKKKAETVSTSDFWYDLTSGGYIKPEKFLEDDDAKRVKEAIKLIVDFENELYKHGYVEEM